MLILMMLAGLAVLTIGAEFVVRAASKLALLAGISPLVIGLTVVAYGTSTPELVVSVQSSLAGNSQVALGNVVGSNIFNVLFILGVSALIIPLRVAQQLIRFDVPLMVGVSILVLLLGLDDRIGRWDGLSLTIGLVLYTVWAILASRRESKEVQDEYQAEIGTANGLAGGRQWLVNSGLILFGLACLVLGSRWFVDSAVEIARHFQLSELVIGLTVVAAGTSLPEVATSVMAAYRGERDIAVGNVVGSNLFNILGVLGLSSLLNPQGVPVSAEALSLDIPVMIVVAISCLPIFFTGHLIARWEGALFLGYYLAYTGYLVLRAVGSNTSELLAVAIFAFALPLTVVTLTIGVVRSIRKPESPD